MRPTTSIAPIQRGCVASARGTARSSAPSAVRLPTLNAATSGPAVTRHRAPATLAVTGVRRTSSDVCVAVTSSTTSHDSASQPRCPSGRSTITSLNAPSGDRRQCPTTTRIPDAALRPAIQPSKRSVMRAPFLGAWTTPRGAADRAPPARSCVTASACGAPPQSVPSCLYAVALLLTWPREGRFRPRGHERFRHF
jgi:hypothetical protein